MEVFDCDEWIFRAAERMYTNIKWNEKINEKSWLGKCTKQLLALQTNIKSRQSLYVPEVTFLWCSFSIGLDGDDLWRNPEC